MQKIISAVMTFVVGFLIYALLFHVHDLTAGDAAKYLPERPSAPLIILVGLQPIYIFGLWLVLIYFRHASEGTFPKLWVKEVETPALGRVIETLSACTMIVLPVIGFGYFWVRLHRGDVWGDAFKPHGIWQFQGFDKLKYGDKALAQAGNGNNGVDFWPFWQPLLCALLSAVILVLVVRIVRIWRARRRAVLPAA